MMRGVDMKWKLKIFSMSKDFSLLRHRRMSMLVIENGKEMMFNIVNIQKIQRTKRQKGHQKSKSTASHRCDYFFWPTYLISRHGTGCRL